MRRAEAFPILASQHGQASVFVLVMLGVVLLITVFLYQSGRLTSEKMQLQNAADAAAFGASTLEARSLNFAAYTNRAMVANEVAVGQLIGMLSWADELKTAEGYASAYSAAIEAAAAFALVIPFVGEAVEAAAQALVAIIETIGGVLTSVGTTLQGVFDVVIPPTIRGISLVNEVYSTSQQIYHGVTYGLIFKNIYQCLEDNIVGASFSRSDVSKKDLPGPQLSDLGILALMGHLPSYWSSYTRTYSSTGAGKDKAQADGMSRLAATVRASRDPFSSGGAPTELNRDWNLDLSLNLKVLKFVLGGDSVGGSEIRRKNDTYDWSGADSLVLGARLKILKWWIPLDAPFGSGGFQATRATSDMLAPGDILPGSAYGPRTPEAYGGAGKGSHLTAWPGVIAEVEENSVAGNPYGGLRPYRDMTNLDNPDTASPAIPFAAPFFLVGVTRPFKDLYGRGPQFAGHYDLTGNDDSGNVDRLGAIAKSQLYFARPSNLGYFLRGDKKLEKANVFSPFWQARLVDTSNADRFLALAIQQKTVWLTEDEKKLIGGSVVDHILKAVDDVLEVVSGIFDRILRLLL